MRNHSLKEIAIQSLLSDGASTSSARGKKISAAADTPFGQTLNELLGAHSANQKVSEEDLFAAAVGQQIKDAIGDELYQNYSTAFQIAMTESPPGRTIPSSQYAARQAVHYLVESGVLSREESKSMRQVANASAQLDEDHRLFDKYAGPNDSTKAVAKFAEAQQMVVERLAAHAQSSVTANVASAVSAAAKSESESSTQAISAEADEKRSQNESSNTFSPRFSAHILS